MLNFFIFNISLAVIAISQSQLRYNKRVPWVCQPSVSTLLVKTNREYLVLEKVASQSEDRTDPTINFILTQFTHKYLHICKTMPEKLQIFENKTFPERTEITVFNYHY